MDWSDVLGFFLITVIVSAVWLFGLGVHNGTAEISPAEYTFVNIMQEYDSSLQTETEKHMSDGIIVKEEYEKLLENYNKKLNRENLKVKKSE